jgi:hypothetical protein
MGRTTGLLPGDIYAADMTFFDFNTEDIDLRTQNQHTARSRRPASRASLKWAPMAKHLTCQSRSAALSFARPVLAWSPWTASENLRLPSSPAALVNRSGALRNSVARLLSVVVTMLSSCPLPSSVVV